MTILFRGFLIFDYKHNRFFMILRRDIELDQYWECFLQNIKQKLNEKNTLEDKILDTQCNYGKVRGKFDDFNKRFLLLIAKNYAEDIYMAELLNEIFAYLINQVHYNSLLIEQIQRVALYQIEQRVQLKENKIFQGPCCSNRKQQIVDQFFSYRKNHHGLESPFNTIIEFQKNFVSNIQNKQIVFKGFMMFDTQKQFFYMLVKRDFENNIQWQTQRYELHQMLANKINAQYKTFFIQGEQGIFLCDFDEQAKTYFILYSQEILPHYSQIVLIKKIRELFLIFPNYKKMNKGEIENKMLWRVVDKIEEEERQYLKDFRQEYYQAGSSKSIKSYKRERGKTEVSFKCKNYDEDQCYLTDFNSEKDEQFDELI